MRRRFDAGELIYHPDDAGTGFAAAAMDELILRLWNGLSEDGDDGRV